MAAPSRKCSQMGCVSQYKPPPARITVLPLLPGDQAKPICGAKSSLLDCVAPSPLGTVELFKIGARYCGNWNIGIKQAGLQVISEAEVDGEVRFHFPGVGDPGMNPVVARSLLCS